MKYITSCEQNAANYMTNQTRESKKLHNNETRDRCQKKNLIVMKRVQPKYGAERDNTQMKREKKKLLSCLHVQNKGNGC